MARAQKAVQLIKAVSKGGFEACSEALQDIEDLGQAARIKVLSIAGVARQGKSTFLELLAGRTGSFKVADGTAACTQGISMLITPREKNTYLVRLPTHTPSIELS
jgi:ABC-type polysaccharide/polyol phosphate transport system ATPase subunit